MLDRRLTRRYAPTDSFIVEWSSRIFDLPHYISPHWWIEQLIPSTQNSYRFTDSWVLGNFLGSIFLFVISSVPDLRWLEWVTVRYGGLLVIEAFFYEVDLLVFSGYRTAKRGQWLRVLSHRRLVVTSLQNYAAIIFWFAVFYRHWRSGFTPVPLAPGIPPGTVDPLLTWLRVSFRTMTTFGTLPMAPSETWTILLSFAQSAIGLSMALLIVVSFVRLLPKPGTKTRFEDEGPPYRPIYYPTPASDNRTSRRNSIMSSVTKESLAMAAAVGAFALGGLTLVLSYLLFASVGAHTWWEAVAKCAGGILFMAIGVGLTIYGLCWLRRKSGSQELKQRRHP